VTVTGQILAGDTVIVACATVNTAITAPTDDASGGSNVYEAITSRITNTDSIQLWMCVNAKAATVVTMHCTSSRLSCCVACYTGASTPGPGSSTTGSGTALSLGTTQKNSASFIVTGFAHVGTGTFGAPNTGNLRVQVGGAGTTTPGVAIVDNTGTVGTSITTSTTNSVSAAWAAASGELQTSVPVWEPQTFLSKDDWYGLGDRFSAPPFLPPALIWVQNWLEAIPPNAQPQDYATSNFAQPDKTPAAAVVTPRLSSWAEDAPAEALWLSYARSVSAFPEKALPPYQFTEPSWREMIPPNAQPQDYAASNLVQPDKATVAASTPVISSWAEDVVAEALWLAYTRAVQAFPEKALPPYQFTVSAWESLRPATAVINIFSKGDTALPVRALPPYQFTEPAWRATQGQLAVELVYAASDVTQAPTAQILVPSFGWSTDLSARFRALTFAPAITTAPIGHLPTITLPSWFAAVAESLKLQRTWKEITDQRAPIQPILAPPSLIGWSLVQPIPGMPPFYVRTLDLPFSRVISPFTVAGWQANMVDPKMRAMYVQTETAALTRIIPPAAITLNHWLQYLAQNGVVLNYSEGDLQTAPDKIIPPAAITLNHWLQYLGQNSLPKKYTVGDIHTAPTRTLPPAAITLGHWLQYLAQNDLPQKYAVGDTHTAPVRILPTVTTLSLDSWLEYLADNAVKLPHAMGDLHTAPAKTLPPAAITLNHWLSNVASNALLLRFLRAVNEEKGFSVAQVSLAAWLEEAAAVAKKFGFAVADSYVAPGGVLPQPVITLASWLSNAVDRPAAVTYGQPPSLTEPEKVFLVPSLAAFQNLVAQAATILHYGQSPDFTRPEIVQAALITVFQQMLEQRALTLQYLRGPSLVAPDRITPAVSLAAFQELLIREALPSVFLQAEAEAGPAKTLPSAPITLSHWLQYLADNAVVLDYAAGDRYTAPDKVKEPAPVTLSHWLQYLADNAVVLRYSLGQETVPEKELPPSFITLNHWLQYLAQNAQPLTFARAEPFSAPTLMQAIARSYALKLANAKLFASLVAFSTYLYSALLAADVDISPALLVSAMNLYPLLIVADANVTPLLGIASVTVGDNVMPLPIKLIPVRLNDQIIEIDGLQDAVTQAYYSSATVTATLVDQSGDAVPGFSDIPMSYVGGSNGKYRGLIEQTFNAPLGTGYTLQVKASVPGGAGVDALTDALWEIPCQVVARTS